ncbi:hypothetical protein DSM112329_01287 [Paraconexibacter sp. AEG42_29]|uniref:Uncharacterized protein n=1 Tax=Paraconexibacter sp. AEG42_29 TaxID=2997339 RepID=A0AAU7ARY1_9ACTN
MISLFGFTPDTRPPGVWAQIEGVPHLLSSTAATHLLDLLSDFDPVWCTGWEERANDHLPGLLGLGPWPVIPIKNSRGAGTSVAGHWKLDAIDAFCGPDRPLAWIDDFLDEACERWATARPGPTLLVPTLPAAGLTEVETTALHSWARDL